MDSCGTGRARASARPDGAPPAIIPDRRRSPRAMLPNPPGSPLDYRAAGVDYDLIDPLKVAAQRAAAATASHLAGYGCFEVEASRGESAYVVDVGPFYLASIVECLGTKALVADDLQRLTGRSYYAAI